MIFAAVINCIIFHYLWFCYAFDGTGRDAAGRGGGGGIMH